MRNSFFSFFSQKISNFSVSFLIAATMALLAGCGSGITTTNNGAVSIVLSASPTTTNTDDSAPTTITVTALSAANAAIPDTVITLGTDTGIVSTPTVTTDATGQATFTFRSGPLDRSNRTATITANAGGLTAQLPVQVVGSTFTVTSTGSTVPDDGTTPVDLIFSAKDAGGNPISGAAVSLTSPVGVTLTPASGTTNINGQLIVSVTGTVPLSGTITASAVGTTASAPITVTSAATTFSITKTQLNADSPIADPSAVTMRIGDSLVMLANAPSATTVTFASTMGSWTGGTSTKDVPVGAGTVCGTITTAAKEACAVLTTSVAGLANIQVYDKNTPSISDMLAVSMTATTPYKVTLQASPSIVPKSVGTTTGSSTLIVTVKDSLDQPVGNVPVAFSIVNPTGGGESVSPVVVYTASTASSSLAMGQAMTTFIAGSQSSSAPGIKIRAKVLGTSVATNTSPSGSDAAIVIGGTAGSIAFGHATVLGTTANATAYTLDMSVLVTDSNGNPAPAGTAVNLSAWPIAWSTGGGCSVDEVLPVVPMTFLATIDDTDKTIVTLTSTVGIGVGAAIESSAFPSGTTVASITDGTTLVASQPADTSIDFSPAGPQVTITIKGYSSTYFNEDRNENLFLDAGEDGRRELYYIPGSTISGGSKDGLSTPVNSAGGVVVSTKATDLPGTVTIDATGLGTFTLTYPKTSAIWTITRIRAKTVVQGSETTSEIQFRLSPLKTDVETDCLLGNSPYNF